MGVVYILHLDTPLHHAKHYVGFSQNGRTLIQRIAHHRNGTGAKFTKALREKGIGFQHVRTFHNVDRNFERKLKNTHNVSIYCPICSKQPREYHPKEKEQP